MEIDGDYANHGYALVRQMVPSEIAQAFLAQVRKVVRSETIDLRSAPTIWVLKRPALDIYSERLPFMRTFLWGLTPAMQAVVGTALLPTYCYFRIYRQGDTCRVHSDRPACEHSLSLTLGLSDNKPWPLAVGRDPIEAGEPPTADDFADEPFVSLDMVPGDAVAYRGVDHRHGRITANPNRWTAHLFCHWVDPGGPHAGHAFDGKEAVRDVDFNFIEEGQMA